MFVAQHLTAVDRLLAQPGPGWTNLCVSEGFSEDDGTALRETAQEFAADCEALGALLTARWGEPVTLDLTGYLLRSAAGEPVPEPLRSLCGYVGELHVWRAGARWAATGVGQQGREQPLQLVAAVGEGDPAAV